MSTQTPPGSTRKRRNYAEGGTFRPRDEAPEPLFGPPHVNYPGKDGRPMADNTLQFQWIVTIQGGLDAVFRANPDVFVAGNLMWYPIEGNNRRRLAPDAMVFFGRPKGHRTSYIQHLEAGVAPQVVFEVLSPGNRRRVMNYKRGFYERYGVQEYYHFDPYKILLEAWIKDGDAFRLADQPNGFVSPLLGIRFELAQDLTIYGPDGRAFSTYLDAIRDRDNERQQAEAERQRAETEHQRAERLAARLRAMGLDPDE